MLSSLRHIAKNTVVAPFRAIFQGDTLNSHGGMGSIIIKKGIPGRTILNVPFHTNTHNERQKLT